MTNEDKPSFQDCVATYERIVMAGSAEDLIEPTIQMIDGISEACSRGGFVEKGITTLGREHWYTRAAAALTGVITNEQTRIKSRHLSQMIMRKQTVAYIFSASGYRSMSHLVELVTQTSDDGQVTVDRARAVVLLVFLNLDDVPDALMDTALAQPAELLLPLVLGWLNQRAVLTAQGEKNRGRLLTSGHLMKNAAISDQEIQPLVNAWMYSSYASDPAKHDIKKWFNQLLADRMKLAGVSVAPVSQLIKSRPTMLVIHERFSSQHAMFRCYAPLLRTLKPFFHTVALADAANIDTAADDLFDEVIRMNEPRPAIGNLSKFIQERNVDVIYYPSLGMSPWTVMLAGLRLAPVQVMTHGHPATSMLETIDYSYVCAMDGDLSLIHSEKTIQGPATNVFQQHTDLPEDLPDLVPPSDREVRIAVNSKVMKLSYRLIDICKRIEREASVPVKFSFFPGERFLFMDGLEAAIRAHLPSATVIPYVEYVTFLNELCKCDLALAAFPFGNTNSTVDTCTLGLPTVAHYGMESPAQSDWMVLRSAGLPNWLVCDSDEAYFQTALKLVNDASARAEAMAGLDRKTLRGRLMGGSERAQSEPFGEVMFKLYKHHAALSSSATRVFDYTDILAMDA